jgi:hypothetical protein
MSPDDFRGTADLDGDGGVDILGNSQIIFQQSLVPNIPWYIAFTSMPYSLPKGCYGAADLDGDGDLDLAGDGAWVVLNEVHPQASGDCNRNGIPDECDLITGVAMDGNQNGIPDFCENALFVRGDASIDGQISLTDVIKILSGLFFSVEPSPCPDLSDVDDSGVVDVTDAVFLLGYLFSKGPAPADPFPKCGPDPTPDGLDCGRFESSFCSP